MGAGRGRGREMRRLGGVGSFFLPMRLFIFIFIYFVIYMTQHGRNKG